jgi:uncharacterized membrane protein YfbV (UPF0208 family)
MTSSESDNGRVRRTGWLLPVLQGIALVALWATAIVRGDVGWFVVAALFTLQVAVFGWWLQTYKLRSLTPDKALLPEAVRLWRERRRLSR